MKTTIDGAGRIVVPKAIRERLALVPGTTIEIEAVADGVFMRPAMTSSALALEGDVLVHQGELAGQIDVTSFMRQQRASRVHSQGRS